MRQTESKPNITNAEQKSPSTLKLMATVALRILGYRKKQFNEDEFQQLSGIQVGIACILAFILFTATMAMLSVFAVKVMS
jgi:hypothetical protein